jgi:hypothetical protein
VLLFVPSGRDDHVPLQNSSRRLSCELSSRSRGSVVFVDHAAEYFAALHRCAERHDDRLVVVGWSLTAGLVRPVAVVVVGVPSQHPPQVLFVVDQHLCRSKIGSWAVNCAISDVKRLAGTR